MTELMAVQRLFEYVIVCLYIVRCLHGGRNLPSSIFYVVITPGDMQCSLALCRYIKSQLNAMSIRSPITIIIKDPPAVSRKSPIHIPYLPID